LRVDIDNELVWIERAAAFWGTLVDADLTDRVWSVQVLRKAGITEKADFGAQPPGQRRTLTKLMTALEQRGEVIRITDNPRTWRMAPVEEKAA